MTTSAEGAAAEPASGAAPGAQAPVPASVSVSPVSVSAPADPQLSPEGWSPPSPRPGCELCEAARFTHWYHEDDICWVADCEVCETPMVVWRHHGTEPPPGHVNHMMARLSDAATSRFGADGWHIDRVMRQIPDHFHAHARDPRWQSRRWGDPPSRYTGVGGERQVRG